MDHLEGQVQRLDPLIVETAPGHGTAQIAALRRGLGGGKRLGAGRVLQGFPVRQAGAKLLHIGRIPPLFLGLHAGRAKDLGLAGRGRGIHGVAPRRLPHLHRDMQVAGFQPGELREVIGLHIFDVIARLLKDIPHQARGDQLSGPVMQRQLDRVGRFLRLGQSGGHGQHGRGQHAHRFRRSGHRELPVLPAGPVFETVFGDAVARPPPRSLTSSRDDGDDSVNPSMWLFVFFAPASRPIIARRPANA